jgi:hypothetical protein
MTTKWSRDHLRDPQQQYRALCGAGYPWPSTISLKDRIEEVDCQACIDKAAQIK